MSTLGNSVGPKQWDTYDKAEVNDAIADGANTALTHVYTKTETDTQISTAVSAIDLSSKQDVLVGGTNIKTVNSISILGSGNIPIAGVVANYQEFTTSGTWTKPDGCNYVYVEAFGGGGSGSFSTGGGAAHGGSGGEFINKILKASDLSNTVSVIIGSGWSSVTVNGNSGNDGGNSSFGSILLAYGGVGGTNFTAGFKRATVNNLNATGGYHSLHFTSSGYGGIGVSTTTYRNGGGCIYGGAGGGSVYDKTPVGGGVSVFGGNGGGGVIIGEGTSGTTPAGGGGGASGTATSSGAGANGIVRVWTW